MLRRMIMGLLIFSSAAYAAMDPAAQLTAAILAVTSFLSNNSATLLSVTIGDQSVKTATFSRMVSRVVNGKVVKTNCKATTTDTHTVLFVGSDVDGAYYYDYVTQKLTGNCGTFPEEPVVRMERPSLPNASDVTSDWVAGNVSKNIVTGITEVDDFGDGSSGLSGIRLDFSKTYLGIEVASAFTAVGTDGDYTWIGNEATSTKLNKRLVAAKVLAMANALSYVKYCDEDNVCTSGRAITLASNLSSLTIGAGVAPTYTIVAPVCMKPAAKVLYGTCKYLSDGVCFEYYGTGWAGVDTTCTGDGGTWSTTTVCPGKADLDWLDAISPKLNPATISSACAADCTTAHVTIAYSYGTTADSTFRNAGIASSKTQCAGFGGMFKMWK